jgi:hypothetical protein
MPTAQMVRIAVVADNKTANVGAAGIRQIMAAPRFRCITFHVEAAYILPSMVLARGSNETAVEKRLCGHKST